MKSMRSAQDKETVIEDIVVEVPSDAFGVSKLELSAQAMTWLDEENKRHFASRVSLPSHDWSTVHGEAFIKAAVEANGRANVLERQLREKFR